MGWFARSFVFSDVNYKKKDERRKDYGSVSRAIIAALISLRERLCKFLQSKNQVSCRFCSQQHLLY